MTNSPHVITQTQAREWLAQVDVPQIMRNLFRDLATGQAVQPAQQLVEFPMAPATSSTIWVCWPKKAFTGSRRRRTSCANKVRW